MNITVDHPSLTIDSPVLTVLNRATFALELTTMKGEKRCVAGDIWLTVPNTRQALPDQPTLRDLVLLVIKRQHPVMEYIAERNGVKIVGYYEHPLSSGRTFSIEHNEQGEACRMVF